MTIEEFHAAHPIHRIIPDECWCGAPAKQAADHICGECPEHCELAAHREGRESPRDVELRRQRADLQKAC
jgi:hypothetical protein